MHVEFVKVFAIKQFLPLDNSFLPLDNSNQHSEKKKSQVNVYICVG